MRPALMDWKELRFGVEIEFVGGNPERVELLPGWIMSFDERQIDDTGAESGSELKPPPIKWEDRGQIREMLARLQAYYRQSYMGESAEADYKADIGGDYTFYRRIVRIGD
ncbi:amidoligase family protein [Cohnella ginsengisoli]|uniref:Amidoligase family protein n=1 Tax=Cohnella ginsengisoli TaxID=425004 RepID=A0A9X4KMK8_9BACL|nr:hypothetical protein [Cohnella ginsengisoli]MDG0795104.1 amidoligase family protein [Cohnella ginsengisoli]